MKVAICEDNKAEAGQLCEIIKKWSAKEQCPCEMSHFENTSFRWKIRFKTVLF